LFVGQSVLQMRLNISWL